jgi:putative aldouronate transport system substrate-binding protein
MADYLDYAQDAVRILGDDAFTGYIGDFLIGLGQMKERGCPAGLAVRKDIFEELGYKAEGFSVATDDYASFNQITELFAKVKQKHPSMICLDGASIMGRQNLSYMDNLGSDFGVLENYGQTTKVANYFESEQYRRFCLTAREWFQRGYVSADIAVNTDSGELKMRAGNCFSFITNVKPNTDVEKLAQTGYETAVIPLGRAMKNTNAVNSALYSIFNGERFQESGKGCAVFELDLYEPGFYGSYQLGH